MTSPVPAKNVRSLSGLLPFLRPYRGRIALAVVFLVLAAASTLVFPVALKSLLDQGLVAADPGDGTSDGPFDLAIVDLPHARTGGSDRIRRVACGPFVTGVCGQDFP